MKPAPAPDQLSLFDEVDPGTHPGQDVRGEGGARPPARPVAPSRPQSHPSEASTAATLLTTQEAAELLHVHPRTVQRLVERGELAAVHLGAAVRFDRGDLADLTGRLKSRAAGPPSAVTEGIGRGATRVSFTERLRSQRDEHRAA